MMYSEVMVKEKSSDLEELTKKFPAAAEYLIQIFVICRDYGIVKNSVISKRLGVSKPAVTQAMSRLKKFNLIEQDLYASINLTPIGRYTASRLLKRHYLLEHLLISKLDYNWVKSDEEASRLQSSISDDFADFLYEKLGCPDTCPHGNPFPGSKRESEIINAPRLITVSAGDNLKIVRITEEGEAADGLLQFCYEHNLRPGRTMFIEAADEKSVTAVLEDKSILSIPSGFAEYICCSSF